MESPIEDDDFYAKGSYASDYLEKLLEEDLEHVNFLPVGEMKPSMLSLSNLYNDSPDSDTDDLHDQKKNLEEEYLYEVEDKEEWTELLNYTNDFIHQIEDNIEPKFQLNQEESLDNLTTPDIHLLDWNVRTVELSIETQLCQEDRDEILQLMEMMIVSVECCEPICVRTEAIRDSVKLEELSFDLHVIEDDPSEGNGSDRVPLNSENQEWRKDVNSALSEEMNRLMSISREHDKSEATSLEKRLDEEVLAALEEDRRQRLERKLRRERERAEALEQRHSAVT